MNSIKTIIFDLGGVVVESGFEYDFYKYVSKEFGIDENKLMETVQNEWDDMEIGKENNEQFWERVSGKLALKQDLSGKLAELWIKFYNEKAPLKKDTLEFIKQLKGKYVVGAITNTQAEHTVVDIQRGVYDDFGIIIRSFEAGLRKPEKEIFEIYLKKAGCKPEESVFIDDIEKNLVNAGKMGIHTICFKDLERLKKDLISLGVKF